MNGALGAESIVLKVDPFVRCVGIFAGEAEPQKETRQIQGLCHVPHKRN